MQRNHIRHAAEAPYVRNPAREQEMKFTMQFMNTYFGIRNEQDTKQKRCKKKPYTSLI